MKRATRWCGLAILAAAAVVGGASPAAANVCGEIPKVLIVLDRSGSMKELAGSQSKWQAARTAVDDLNKQFSSQLALGLMLYPTFPDVHACSPGKVGVKPSTTSGGDILATLNKAYPSGNTPLAATLDEARAHLAAAQGKLLHIILITDGKETCLSPAAPQSAPGSCTWDNGTNYRKCGGCGWQFCLKSGTWSSSCQARPEAFACPGGQTCSTSATCSGPVTGSLTPPAAAQQLAQAGIKVHVVGFGDNVDPVSLAAIASSGGTGSYHKATNLSQLKAAFSTIAAGISCCGNGQLDPGEACDTALPANHANACPGSCDDGDPCTTDALSGTSCGVTCSSTAITATVSGDGCCPVGATSQTDSDCAPSCGNGALDSGETCDPKIPQGQAGACALSCDDGDPCTDDSMTGGACAPSCGHAKLGADLTTKDGCCPAGLSSEKDVDCKPPCSPLIQTDCVDLCQGVNCGDGEHCAYGQCVPWPGAPDEAGCDCRLGRSGGDGAAGGALVGLLGLLLLWRRRRGR